MESKKVIVTGGNRGIGKGIVLSLLEQSYHVLATSRDTKKFDISHPNLKLADLDVCDDESVLKFQEIVNKYDPDILINNAGITKDNLFIRMKDDEWKKFEIETRHSRHYPLGDQIATLVGFYGKDGAQEGLEKSYDNLLSLSLIHI